MGYGKEPMELSMDTARRKLDQHDTFRKLDIQYGIRKRLYNSQRLGSKRLGLGYGRHYPPGGNGAYAIIQYLEDGDLLFNSVGGPFRVKL